MLFIPGGTGLLVHASALQFSRFERRVPLTSDQLLRRCCYRVLPWYKWGGAPVGIGKFAEAFNEA